MAKFVVDRNFFKLGLGLGMEMGMGMGNGNGKVPPVPGDDSIISGTTTTHPWT